MNVITGHVQMIPRVTTPQDLTTVNVHVAIHMRMENVQVG